MPAKLEFNCLPTAIGSMPHTDPNEACSLVMRYLPAVPAWPQLPKRSPKENFCIQFSEGFPGVVVNKDKVHIEPSANFDAEIERIYTDCEESNPSRYGISGEYAAGLHAFLAKAGRPGIVKGQLTGPITWGLLVTRQDGRAILYDDALAEVMAKFLRLKAAWQEDALRQISSNTIIFVDEPYLISLGSVFTPIPEEKVPSLLEEVLKGIRGLKGIHCCGNTNWSVLLHTPIDILSFDAYNCVSSLSTYPSEVKSFIERGGSIAWGIVPSDEEALTKESLPSLYDRLGEAMALFTRNGVKFRQIVAQSLITPSCGLATLSLEAASQALELLAKLSDNLRRRYSV